MYAPEFYIREFRLAEGQSVKITEQNLMDVEVALYFMEHCESLVAIERSHKNIKVKGTVTLMGDQYPLYIEVHLD